MLAVSLVYGKICKTCSTGWSITFQYFTDLCCLSETLVVRVLRVTVIPDCPVFFRDAWIIKFHLYIALLCSQCSENVYPIIGIGA